MRVLAVARVVTAAVGLVSAALTAAGSARAAPAQRWPYAFDPSLAADPAATQAEMTSNDVGLPALPVASMETLMSAAGATTLWVWPETAAALKRAGASGPGSMTWPTTPSLCAKHAAFAMPSLAPPGASPACASAASAVAQTISGALGACEDVEQPERYVLAYTPAKPDATNTGSVEGLVGLAGEALSHFDVPANLLPPEFVPTLRTILVKIRHDALATRLSAAKAAYASALAQAGDPCFDPAAKASVASSIAALEKEVDDASAYVAKTVSDGEAAWAHDGLCLAARSRTRGALPFPSLTEAERRFVAFWLGGVYWRMRGGGLMPLGSTQQARLYFLNAPFTQIGALTGGQDGADAAFQIYLAVFEGWGDWMDMGTTPGGGDKYFDLVGMTARGHRQVQAAADQLAGKGYDTVDLVAGGLQMGPCYFYGLDPLKDFRYADQASPPYGAFIEGFTAIGEFCSGASIGLGFARTLLDGKPTGAPPTVDLCANKQCGDDGCGGSCGTCADGLSCQAGSCAPPGACAPRCEGKPAGADDGCGGACAGGAAGPSSPSEPSGASSDADDGAAPGSSAGGCACAAPGARAPLAGGLALALAACACAVGRRRRRRVSPRAPRSAP
jgi:hypothetical protein